MTIRAKTTCPESLTALFCLVGIFWCLVDKYLVRLAEITRGKPKGLDTKGHKVVLYVLSPLLSVSLVLGHFWNSIPIPAVSVGHDGGGCTCWHCCLEKQNEKKTKWFNNADCRTYFSVYVYIN